MKKSNMDLSNQFSKILVLSVQKGALNVLAREG